MTKRDPENPPNIHRNQMQAASKSSMSVMAIKAILPLSLRLKFVFECTKRGGTTNPLQLALNVLVEMLVCSSVRRKRGCTATAAAWSTGVLVVQN
jgi:hypothetical protein